MTTVDCRPFTDVYRTFPLFVLSLSKTITQVHASWRSEVTVIETRVVFTGEFSPTKLLQVTKILLKILNVKDKNE